MKHRIFSIDLFADFGFLKKPDINEGIYLSFNMLHKPALLGILGAIIGLEGYQEKNKIPKYYEKLNDIKIGIAPLNCNKGNYLKTVIQYVNGVGYASHEKGGTLIVKEQTLIKPAFRCFILYHSKHSYIECLVEYLKNNFAEFLPYLGKNEYSLWWNNLQEYRSELFNFDHDYKVGTIFMKSDQIVKEMVKSRIVEFYESYSGNNEFISFEELPVGIDPSLIKYNIIQYERKQFVYTNFTLSKELRLTDLYKLEGQDEVIQLF